MEAGVADTLRALAGRRGGLVNAHSHLDIAYVLDLPAVRAALAEFVTGDVTAVAELPLRVKIDRLDHLLRTGDEFLATLAERLERALAAFRGQGVRACRTCVTVGTDVSPRSLEVVAAARDASAPAFVLQLTALPLCPLAPGAERDHFARLCRTSLVDVVGGLPQHKPGAVDAYLDLLFEIAGAADKPLEVHVDEYLSADERETASLAAAALRARRRGYGHPVTAVHCVTLASLPGDERRRTAAALAEAGVAVAVCPRAALSMRAIERPTYLHNAIAPVRDLLAEGVVVALGTDNIRDVFMPLGGGSLLEEIEMLAEAVRLYDLETLAAIATTGGAAALGLS